MEGSQSTDPHASADPPATTDPCTSTDPPAGDVENVPEMIKDAKEAGPSFHCDLCDAEMLFKMIQALLPGLATACVDNTTGGVFMSPGSVASDLRREMVEYLTQRSETFVAESVVLDGDPETEAFDNPYDIIAFLIDEFAVSKRNLFSRVSALLLSERREDSIDDFAQKMETKGFWPVDKREVIVQTLLKNVDVKHEYHCDEKFETAEELALHRPTCSFRVMNCENEGCDARFSFNQSEKHDTTCPFKIIPCEQKCPDFIMRRDMDRHCITVCRMKLVNCPFFSVGCKAAVPQCKIEEHQSEELHYHILYILQGFHKEASDEVLKERVDKIEEISDGRLTNTQNVRSLTSKVKDLDAKLPPLVIENKKNDEETSETEANLESRELNDTNEDTRKAAGTKEVLNSEAAPPLEATPMSKDGEEAQRTEIEDSEAMPRSLEVEPLKKDSEEGSEIVVKDAEAKHRSSEDSEEAKDGEEAERTEIEDSEAMPRSPEVVPLKKDSEEGSNIVVKDVEAKHRSSEDSEEAKDGEEAERTEIEDCEAMPRSPEVEPLKKDSEEGSEIVVKDAEDSEEAKDDQG